jgi:hypothetical protein
LQGRFVAQFWNGIIRHSIPDNENVFHPFTFITVISKSCSMSFLIGVQPLSVSESSASIVFIYFFLITALMTRRVGLTKSPKNANKAVQH